MTTQMTPMKLISMTCEQSVAQRTMTLLQKHSVKSIRTYSVRIEEFDGEASVDLHESQTKLEFLVFPEKLEAVVSDLSKQLLSRFDVGFYVTDAQVLRPAIFCD
ncbi:MAG: hypothetical protein EBR09_13750 [Proteobacteria bacterium]|nr:hypothetical protein [Pseudomonadota bacterium]